LVVQIRKMGEGVTEFGGVTMRGMTLTRGRERMGEIARAIVAAVLFSLVIGIWVCLWVPSALIF
jgi:hypothetical protein